MSTDIKLGEEDPDLVIIEGLWLESRTWDLRLDHPSRRGNDADPNTPRRALVHDPSDGLTINFAGDYPGGVTIEGSVKCPANVSIGDTLTIQGAVTLDVPAVAESESGFVEIGSENPAKAALGMGEDPFRLRLLARTKTIDLAQEIALLRHLLLSLNDRLRTVESRFE